MERAALGASVTSHFLSAKGLCRALATGIEPRRYQRAELRLRTRRWRAFSAWMPGPTDQFVLCHVVKQLRAGHVGTRRVQYLSANLAKRLALPGHFNGREFPFRVARHAGRREIGVMMTCRTAKRCYTAAVRPARHQGPMRAHCVRLRRPVGAGVAVHAAGMLDHPARFGEQSNGPGFAIGYGRKRRRRAQGSEGNRRRISRKRLAFRQ